MKKITTWLNGSLGTLIGFVLLLIAVRMVNPQFLSNLSEWNGPPAIAATFLLLCVLWPGILQRMGVPMRFLKYPIVFRRTLGMAMYLCALVHFLFLIDYLPWFSDGIIENFDALTASGIAAVILLVPVLFTSNNISVRLFGRWWKVIQRMTYLAIPFVAIHLWESGQGILAMLYAITAIFIIVSYYIKIMRKGASPLMTSLLAVGVITLALGLVFVTLKYLFKNPADQKKDQRLEEANAQMQKIEEQKNALQAEVERKESLLVEEQAKVAEFERIKKEKEDAIAAKDAEEKAREEKVRAEVEAKAAEAARLAALFDYSNGTYTGVGSYSTDKGKKTERIDVKLSIAKDKVTGVEIISHAKANKSIKYVGRFKKDIAGVVVGRDVDSLDVHGIGGASDTSTGFRTALGSIKAKATQK